MADEPVVRIYWPFSPNWKDPYRVRYDFLTDVFTASAGNETRRSLRLTPRKTLSFSIMLEGSDLILFERMMNTAQNMPFVMPEVTRYVSTTGAIGSGGVTVNVNAVPSWLKAGVEVILGAGATGHVASVLGVSGNTVTFTAAVGAWPAGTRLTYAVTGNLPTKLSKTYRSSNVMTASIELNVNPASEDYNIPAAPIKYRNRELFGRKPNWATDPTSDHIWPVEAVDFNYGRAEYYRHVDFPQSITAVDHTLFDHTEAEALLEFFLRMRGQRGEFYTPALTHDFQVGLPMTAGNNTITLLSPDLWQDYLNDPVRCNLAIILNDGTIICRHINSMAPGTGNTTVTLAESWATTIQAYDVNRVTWLMPSRLASDTFELEWVSNGVAQTRLSIQSLPDAVNSSGDNLRATLQDDDRETLAGDDRAIVYF